MSMLEHTPFSRHSKKTVETAPDTEATPEVVDVDEAAATYQESFFALAKITYDWNYNRGDKLEEPEISLVKQDIVDTARTHTDNFLQLRTAIGGDDFKPDLSDLYRLAEAYDITRDPKLVVALDTLFDFKVINSEILYNSFAEAVHSDRAIFDVLHELEARQPIDF